MPRVTLEEGRIPSATRRAEKERKEQGEPDKDLVKALHVLEVESVDLMSEQSEQNRREHHTDPYDGDDLILRRGQTFMMWLDLSRPFDPITDKLRLELKTVHIIHWGLPFETYQDQLIDQAALMLTLSGRVSQTQQVLATQFNFRLRSPDLVMKPIGEAMVGKEMAVEISFTNPLPVMLKAVTLRVEGLGLQKIHKVDVGNIGSQASFSRIEHFVPSRAGARKLLASLDCKELTQVLGVANILVKEKNGMTT